MHLLGPLETPPLHGLAAYSHPLSEWVAGAVISTWALSHLVSSGRRGWFAGVVAGHLHHPHAGHCDDHGALSAA
jgi:hypothetical protein